MIPSDIYRRLVGNRRQPPATGKSFRFVRACVRAKLCARDSVSRVGTEGNSHRVAPSLFPFPPLWPLWPFCLLFVFVFSVLFFFPFPFAFFLPFSLCSFFFFAVACVFVFFYALSLPSSLCSFSSLFPLLFFPKQAVLEGVLTCLL